MGLEVGFNYVFGLSLGWLMKNEEREVEVMRVLKGNLGKGKVVLRVKVRVRILIRRKIKDWRIE